MNPVSYLQISESALLHNLRAFRHLLDRGTKVAAVVKANAYGHGLPEVIHCIDGETDVYQVDDIEELRALRRLTSRRILVLGYVCPEDLEEAVALEGEICLFEVDMISAIAAAADKMGKQAEVHVEVDALLGRLGALPPDLQAICDRLSSEPRVHLAGVYAHFANIEDTTDLAHASEQIAVFEKAASLFPGVPRHISATSGLLAVEGRETRNDLIRLGVGLYGLYPSAALERSHATLELRPAMRWLSRLAQVKTLPARHPVSYGLTYITSKSTRVGIVPQGYSDGYDRHLSSSGEVLVGGQRCRVLGRVAMNMMVVELENVPNAQAGDEVVLLGPQGNERISAEELALRIGTINYEVVARVSPLLPRFIIS